MRKSYFVFVFFILSIITASQSYAQPLVGWIQRYNDPLVDSIDVATSIAIDNSGNVYVTGYSYTLLNFLTDIVTIKYRGTDGTQLWRRTYSGLLSDRGNKIIVDKNNRYVYVTGYTTRLLTLTDYVTIKYDTAGALQWDTTYDRSLLFDEAKSIGQDVNGKIYVTGYTTSLLHGRDYTTIKYNQTNGNQVWIEHYDGPTHGNDESNDIAVDSDEGVFVTGSSQGNASSVDCMTIMYYTYGGYVWGRRVSGNNEAVGNAITTDSRDFVLVTGYSKNGSSQSNDYMTIKYDNDGAEQWRRFYSGINNGGEDRAYAIVVDSYDNVIVTGESEGSGTNQDYATIKYTSNGNQQWGSRYNGTGNGQDRAYAIVVDNAENVVVTGATERPGTGSDYGTVKYNGTNGNQQWVAFYDGTGNDEDRPYAIVVDNANDPIVTGSSRNGSWLGSEDYLTIKYGTAPLVEINSNQTPSKFSLSQNYPNPFNPMTYIRFDVAFQTDVNLSLYNVLGKEIAVLVNQKLSPGSYEVSLNSERLLSGVYFYRISMGDFTETKKMILLK
jgi:uncharacterized delta-60 repeat protein